jgi:hypothetical protein
MGAQSRTLAATVALAAASALATALAATSSASTPPNRAASPFVEPSSVSPACGRDAHRHAACGVIATFFRAVNSGRFGTACSLLGAQLKTETYGLTCERFIEVGVPEPMPWGILGAAASGSGVVVLVALGQSELDHIRMRRHRALVDVEGGRLRILRTQIVG